MGSFRFDITRTPNVGLTCAFFPHLTQSCGLTYALLPLHASGYYPNASTHPHRDLSADQRLRYTHLPPSGISDLLFCALLPISPPKALYFNRLDCFFVEPTIFGFRLPAHLNNSAIAKLSSAFVCLA